MDIVRFAGGLGNQMFQYAFVEALRSRGREVRGSLGYYKKHPESGAYVLASIFSNIELDYISDHDFEVIDNRWQEIKRNGKTKEFCNNYTERFFWVEDVSKEPCKYHPDIFLTKNCTFVGYWQTDKYFKDIRDVLEYRFKYANVSNALKAFGDMLSENEYVSVHVRRGDYLLHPEIYMGICTKDYYVKAIDYIKRTKSYSKFIFFSDDLNWVKENLNVPDAIYCNENMFEHYEDWYDMYLMSRCRHNIIANSSFSWWSAWLNKYEKKVVVAPSKWYWHHDTPDIWCKEWVKI